MFMTASLPNLTMDAICTGGGVTQKIKMSQVGGNQVICCIVIRFFPIYLLSMETFFTPLVAYNLSNETYKVVVRTV